MKIIYEDNHLIVVEKPINQPSQEDASQDLDMVTEIKAYLVEKYNKPGDAYLGLVHRLDRPVGGVMVFAKTSKAASRLSQQIREGDFKKEYIAIVEGYIEAQSLEDYLYKDRRSNTSYVTKNKKKGKYARLDILKSEYHAQHQLSKLEIDLITGRSHQIRVQLASRNLAIWGDARYNPKALPGEQIALWAHRLSFNHPTKKERLTFTSPAPEKFPYSLW